MRGYEAQRIARFASRHSGPKVIEPTMAEFEASVWRVHLTPGSGMQAVHHVIAFDEMHAIAVARTRERCGEDVKATATLSPVYGLDEAETKAALMAGESQAERDWRRQLYATRIGSVL